MNVLNDLQKLAKKGIQTFLKGSFLAYMYVRIVSPKPFELPNIYLHFLHMLLKSSQVEKKSQPCKKVVILKKSKMFLHKFKPRESCLPFVSIHGKKCSRNLFKLARFIGTICFKVNLDQLTTQKHGSWEVKHTNPNNKFSHLQSMFTSSSIDNRRKEVSTKLWYSTMGRSAMHWLSPFSGIVRACAHALIFFTAVSKRDVVSHDV